ncbi:MAG TPA: hypothetical protein VNO30_08515 [Kofleriaceae bacterium]|nr:hypothetical protein [Kofleriaceae bacterium]
MAASESTKYLRESVETAVRSGFYKQAELLDDLGERIADEIDDDADVAAVERELTAYAKKLLAAQREAEAKWTKPTMNDRIDAAFAQLKREGIIALQNAGYTMSNGWEDANEAAHRMDPPARGATFYHGQDLERGVKNQGLMLAFGAYVKSGDNEQQSVALGKDICATLARYGVPTKWNGSVDSRIEIPKFKWQRRQFTKAPKVEPVAPKANAKPKPNANAKPNAKPKPKPKPNAKPKRSTRASRR